MDRLKGALYEQKDNDCYICRRRNSIYGGLYCMQKQKEADRLMEDMPMEQILIIMLLLGGIAGMIYVVWSFVRLADVISVVDMGAKRYDRNSNPEGD